MHPKDPIPDTEKTDIICYLKCPAHTCTGKYIGPSKKEFQTIEIKPALPPETTTSLQNTQKYNLQISP